MDEFLKRVLPDADVRHYLQRLVGVALLGSVKEHILPILTGEGRNGKGTFYEALLYSLGGYGGTAEPDLFMHREGAHPTGQMDLRGRRFVVVSENDRDRRLAEATMKRLTGGDPIKARYMRENFVEFIPSHLAMLVTNHLPRVNGDDPAIWARMRVIPFDVVIPKTEQDGNLGEKLEAEADVILAWAIQGLKDYLRRGSAEPPRVLAATEKYHEDSDDVGRFIAACCVTDSRAHFTFATSTELHDAWQEWQREDGCPKLGLQAFGKVMDRKGHNVLPARHGRRERNGIGLKAVECLANVTRQLAEQS
ncbi:hypothetical protein H7H51_26150 [Mycolicibacterium farcinogenes]|nr:hypothetical protein [Mycolicibacterium farcinogenes]